MWKLEMDYIYTLNFWKSKKSVWDLRLDKDFFGMIHKALSLKEKNDKLNFIKIKYLRKWPKQKWRCTQPPALGQSQEEGQQKGFRVFDDVGFVIVTASQVLQ